MKDCDGSRNEKRECICVIVEVKRVIWLSDSGDEARLGIHHVNE